MYHRFSWITPAIVILFISCNAGDSQLRTQGNGYRDLKGYFKQELEHVMLQKPALQKTVTLNNKRDSLTINAPDSTQLHDLLQPFMEVDLNKPSLQNAYDTILLPDQFSGKRSLLYKARDAATLPQEVKVEMDNQGRIESVQVNKHVRNLVYEYQQNLLYRHNKQIRITTWQKIAFLSAKELDVKVLLTTQH